MKIGKSSPKRFADLLGVDQATVRKVLQSWGTGHFDAEMALDGKGFRPDRKTSAVLIPPAFGLAGVTCPRIRYCPGKLLPKRPAAKHSGKHSCLHPVQQ